MCVCVCAPGVCVCVCVPPVCECVVVVDGGGELVVVVVCLCNLVVRIA